MKVLLPDRLPARTTWPPGGIHPPDRYESSTLLRYVHHFKPLKISNTYYPTVEPGTKGSIR